MTNDTRRIWVWPDGTWVDQDEQDNARDAWRGDDHVSLTLPANMTDEDIDEAARRAVTDSLGPDGPRSIQDVDR